MANGTRSVILDKQTLIPIGSVISIVGVLLWGILTISGLKYEVKGLKIELQTMNQDRWTGTDMRNWVKLTHALNPELELPTPSHDPNK